MCIQSGKQVLRNVQFSWEVERVLDLLLLRLFGCNLWDRFVSVKSGCSEGHLLTEIEGLLLVAGTFSLQNER